MSNVRVGTSGWNYPKGPGTWNGVFYPASDARPKGFDELAYYAQHFDTVEVNSTFYGQPREAVTRSWATRTPPGFEFSIKLYQKFTHPRMFRERVAGSLSRAEADLASDEVAEVVTELARPTQADLDEFRRGIAPLAAAGKLGVLLAQFPPSFKNTEAERDYLAGLLRTLSDYPMAVELRHRSWSDEIAGTLDLLNSHEASWVQIDEPKFQFSIRQNLLPNLKGVYYIRLHGRNAAQWWRHDTPDDRYNYCYSDAELQEFSGALGAVRTIVKKAYLYTNNHYSAKSVANAVTIKRQLGEPIEGEYLQSFIERYPDLRDQLRMNTRRISSPA